MSEEDPPSRSEILRRLTFSFGVMVVGFLVLLFFFPESSSRIMFAGSFTFFSTVVLCRLLDKSARQGTFPSWVVAPALVFNFGASAFLAYMAGTALIRLLT
ncbi:hypothetical protein VR010_09920 [Actinomycetaceae bacterium L2_0104]